MKNVNSINNISNKTYKHERKKHGWRKKLQHGKNTNALNENRRNRTLSSAR